MFSALLHPFVYDALIHLLLFLRYIPGTDWTASGGCPCSAVYGCLPVVAFRALPPDLTIAGYRDLLRCQSLVMLRIPLWDKLRAQCGKVVVARKHGPSRTDRATRTHRRCPRAYFSRPRVPFGTAPPSSGRTVRRHLPRHQTPVLFRIPLRRNVRPYCFQIIVSRQHSLSRTKRTPYRLWRRPAGDYSVP